MKRLYLIQQDNTHGVDTSIYFDIDNEKETFNLSFYGGREWKSNCVLYEKYEKMYDYLIDEYYYFENGYEHYSTISEMINDVIPKQSGKKYSNEEIHRLKEIASKADYFHNIADEILTLATGEQYAQTDIHGCCQGDWATVTHPASIDTEFLKFIEACVFGTGEEFGIVIEDSDNVLTPEQVEQCEIFYDYTHIWRLDDYKSKLSQEYNIPLENIVYLEIESKTTVTTYKYKIA